MINTTKPSMEIINEFNNEMEVRKYSISFSFAGKDIVSIIILVFIVYLSIFYKG